MKKCSIEARDFFQWLSVREDVVRAMVAEYEEDLQDEDYYDDEEDLDADTELDEEELRSSEPDDSPQTQPQ